MTVQHHSATFRRLSTEDRNEWDGAESAGVSDCLERSMAMDAGIAPLAPKTPIIGQARTVRCMAGDNSALHAALELAEPGDVLVADAGGYLGNAVWGGLMTLAAVKKGIQGLIVDGAVRDRGDIENLDFPCYARGCTPAGPHKGFGGAFDAPISCGGVPVHSGDLIIADEDGVCVVPLNRIGATLEAYRALKKREAKTIQTINEGGSLAGIYGVPEVVLV